MSRLDHRICADASESIEKDEVEMSAPWTLNKILLVFAGIGAAIALAAIAAAAGAAYALYRLIAL